MCLQELEVFRFSYDKRNSLMKIRTTPKNKKKIKETELKTVENSPFGEKEIEMFKNQNLN